jgi:hypothetical protein
MITPEERQSILDDDHLRLLSIGYYILGGTHLVVSFIPLIYIALGALLISTPLELYTGEASPEFIGWFFVIIGVVFAVGFLLLGALQLFTGRCLKRRESRTLCLIVAAITCALIPYGTAVGVFTFIVLRRQSVELLFDPMYTSRTTPQQPPSDPP